MKIKFLMIISKIAFMLFFYSFRLDFCIQFQIDKDGKQVIDDNYPLPLLPHLL
jgi:hypothetical protein